MLKTSHVRLWRSLLLRIAVGVAMVWCALVHADDLRQPPLRLAQLRHTIITPEQGAPVGVQVMRQAPDGRLWMVSSAGLTSYDGATFDASLTPRLTKQASRALYIEPSGVIWVGHNFGGISRITGNRVEKIDTTGLPPGTPFEFARTADGVFWVATTHGLAQFDRAGHWRVIGTREGYAGGNPEGMVLDSAGTLWVADARSTWRRDKGQRAFVRAGTRLVIDRIYTGLPPDSTRRPDTADGDGLLDSSGAFWQATDSGLSRSVIDKDGHTLTDEMTPANGLSHFDVQSFFEDREGNVWVATDGGLERFQATRFTPYPLPGQIMDPNIVAGDNADIYMATDWQAPFHIASGVETLSRVPKASAIGREPSGAIWFGGGPTLTRWANGVTTTVPLPAEVGNPRRLVNGIAALSATDVWVSIGQTGLFRFHEGTWTRESGSGGFPVMEPRVVAAVGDHVWLGYPDGRLDQWSLATGLTHVLQAPDKVGDIKAVAESSGTVWVGGSRGLVRLSAGHAQLVQGTQGEAVTNISGILVARQGDVWVTSRHGVFRLRERDIPVAAGDAPITAPFDYVAASEGLGELTDVTGPSPVLAETSDGRIWVASRERVAFADPGALRAEPAVPAPIVESLVADAVAYPPGAGSRLPPRPRNIVLTYTSPYLAIPERVQFRYQLQGYDGGWRYVGTRRDAAYTNLDDGDYTFQVQASLDGRHWSPAAHGATFAIAPAYFQTDWFRALIVLGVVLLSVFVQWAWRRMTLMEAHARVDERVRVARDLHDTFLQNVQAFILRTNVAMTPTLAPERREALLKSAVAQAEASLREGREKVGHLRTPTLETDLVDYLYLTGQHLAELDPVSFRVDLIGKPVPLARSCFEQLQPLCQEAIINAFRHAGASMIDVSVRYTRAHLMICIRDDGKGMSDHFRQPEPGHWGLFGMRERAEAMGARLRIRSGSGEGTLVEIRLAGRRIYSQAPVARVRRAVAPSR